MLKRDKNVQDNMFTFSVGIIKYIIKNDYIQAYEILYQTTKTHFQQSSVHSSNYQ